MPLRDIAVGPVQRNGAAARGRAARRDEGARQVDRRSSPTPARTRSTSPAGSTTSATPGVYDALGGESRAGAERQRVRARQRRAQPVPAGAARPGARRRRPRRASATAAPARPSAARATLQADARLPLRPDPDAARAVRRALGILPRRRRGPRAVVARRRRRRRQRGASTYWVELDNAFGLIQRRRPQGRRRPRGQDHRPQARPQTQPRARRRSEIDQNGFGVAAHRRDCETAPAVADRRVLPRLPARARRGRSSSPARRSRSRTPPRRSRPTSSTTSCAARTASACGSSSASSAPASPARGATSTRRSAARVPALRETDQVLAILGEQNTVARATSTATRTRSSATSPANRKDVGRWVDEGARHRAAPRPSAAPSIAAGFQRCPASSRAAPDDGGARRRRRRARAPALQQPRRVAPAAQALLRPARAVLRRVAPGVRALGQASADRPPGRARRPAPTVAQLNALRRRDAGARQEPGDRPRAPRRPQRTPSRSDPRSPGGAGLHGPRGAAAVRLRPGDGDATSSTSTATCSRSPRSTSECAHYADVKRVKDDPTR